MDWFSKKLEGSETKLFGALVESLRIISQEVRVDKAQIGCSRQIGYMHTGLEIWFPDGEKLYLHRCMNRWIYTNNSVGMNPSDFFLQFASTREAEQLLTKLIRDTLESKQSTEMRGSGALKGRADCVMTMFDDKGFISPSAESQSWIALSTTFEHGGKNRNAQTETLRGIYLGDCGEGQKVFMQAESESMSKQSSIVKERLVGLMTVREFALQIGGSHKESTARRYLDKAIAEGVAECIKGSRQNEPTRYQLTEQCIIPQGPNWRNLITRAAEL